MEREVVKRVPVDTKTVLEARVILGSTEILEKRLPKMILEILSEARMKELDWWDGVARACGFNGINDAKMTGYSIEFNFVSNEAMVFKLEKPETK